MRINTNITALNTFNSYTTANNKIASSVAKLSSGYAINSAADNAAGLAISEKMRAQIRGLDKASSNSQDAISLVQTAEGSLSSTDEILQRMREISVQSSSDTNEDDIDRDALQSEFSQLQQELDEISEDSTYNNQNLLNGNLSSTKSSVSVSTSASGLSATVGKADAGTYSFGVKVVTTAEAVTGKAPTSPTVSNSSVNSYFSGIDSSSSNTAINSDAHSALLNGNYEITGATVGEDGTITVTATGDNDQTFTATLSKADYEGATNGTDSYTLDFGSDAFKITFNKSAGIGTNLDSNDSKITDLANAFKGTEFTVSGGVADKAAEKAVYASMTGASDVKLEAGMNSVTFDNGVTVNFNKLTAADLDTNAKYTNVLTPSTSAVTWGADTATASTLANIDIKSLFGGSYSASGAVTAGDDYSLTVGGTEYTYTAEDGDTQDDVVDGLVTELNAAKVSVTNDLGNTVHFTAAQDGTSGNLITFAGDDTSVDNHTAAAASVAFSGGSLSTYNFESVFGEAAAGASTSTVTVTSEKNDGLTIQVGANSGDEMQINIDRADSEYLGVKGLDISTQEGAAKAIDVVNNAINQVSSQRAYLGAVQNRLNYKIDNLTTSSQNLTSAESSIRDVDMAKEMTNFTNANILSQASTAMLAQANALPQNVLSLLG